MKLSRYVPSDPDQTVTLAAADSTIVVTPAGLEVTDELVALALDASPLVKREDVAPGEDDDTTGEAPATTTRTRKATNR